MNDEALVQALKALSPDPVVVDKTPTLEEVEALLASVLVSESADQAGGIVARWITERWGVTSDLPELVRASNLAALEGGMDAKDLRIAAEEVRKRVKPRSGYGIVAGTFSSALTPFQEALAQTGASASQLSQAFAKASRAIQVDDDEQ